jgi:3-deoxy-D-manno-octulosonate 8-phosphate phosphatase (KDO 8-P phosphatase)
MLTSDFIAKAQAIKLIIFDVDGVFTDGSIYVDDHGSEIKSFNVLDGLGIKLLRQTPIHVAVISGRDAPGVSFRMQQLGITHIFQGHSQKLPIYENLLQQLVLKDHEVACVGDDLPDLPIFRRVGLAITVPNAVKEVKALVPYMTTANGGKGAVREVCENIMRAQGSWDEVVRKYTG